MAISNCWERGCSLGGNLSPLELTMMEIKLKRTWRPINKIKKR